MFSTNHQLSNKAADYSAALDHKRIGPFQIIQHDSGDVYFIQKIGKEQKVHGRDPHNHEIGEEPPPHNYHLSTSDKEQDAHATHVANRIIEQPYTLPLDRAHHAPNEEIYAPGPSGLSHPLTTVQRTANCIVGKQYAQTFVQALQMPVEGIHAPGSSGLARPPTTASPQFSVTAQAHSSVQREEKDEDEEQNLEDSSKDNKFNAVK